MKKQLLGFLLLFLMSPLAYAQLVVQSYPFPHAGGSASSIAVDPADNLVMVGYLTNGSIRKTDQAGNVLWQVGMAGNIRHVATDQAGNVYVVGFFIGQITTPIGTGHSTGTTAAHHLVLAKFNSSGVFQWSRSFGGVEDAYPTSIHCDANGDVVLIGEIDGNLWSGTTINFGNGHSINSRSYVVKISPSGTTLWAKEVHGEVETAVVTTSGQIALIGRKEGNSQPLNIAGVAYPDNDSFTALLNSSGTPLWVAGPITSSGNNAFLVSALASDAAGNIYVTGRNYGTTNYGAGTVNGVTEILVKYSATGAPQWVKPLSGNLYVADMMADVNGNILFSASFEQTISIQNNSFTSTGGTDMLLGRLNALGDLHWAITGTSNTQDSERLWDIALDSQGNCFALGETYISTWPPVHTVTFGNYTAAEEGTLLYKVSTTANQVSGSAFYDLNTNGQKDPAEPYAPGLIAQALPSGSVANTMANGRYSVFTGSGSYTVSLPAVPPAYVAVPGSHTGSFAGVGQSDTARHFALQPIPNMQDLELIATAIAPARPGFAYPIQLTYKNVGSTVLNGSVEALPDAQLLLTGTSPAFTSQTGNALTWTFSNLQPLQTQNILIEMTVPATTPLGTSLSSSFTVNPLAGDITPANNAKTIAAVVQGAFDPNDKQVSQNHLTPTEVSEGKYLEYTIRFQNTGTDTAFTVRLIDTLDAQLNIPTFEMLASSHANTWSIRGNGILEWRFDNILLPDSNTNEPASHGFVKYRIRPNTNLQLGNVIRNTAAIYFDFNAPVITNTTTTEVALVSAIADVNKPQLQVYRNPNKGSFIVALQNVQEQSIKAELRNVLGQVVWQQNVVAENGHVQQQIKTNNLNRGVYFLQVGTANGMAVQKVVIE